MKIKTVRFVSLTALFAEHENIKEELDEFGLDEYASEAEHSLASPSVVIDALLGLLEASDDKDTNKQVKEMLGIVRKLPKNVMIDLQEDK